MPRAGLSTAAKVHMNPSHFATLQRRLCGVMLLCAGGGMQAAMAQAPAAADPRFAPAAERARQEGDKVLMRILRDGATAKRIGPAAAPEPAAPAPTPAPAGKPAAGTVVSAGKPPERAAPAQRKPAAVAEAAPAPAAESPPSAAAMPPNTQAASAPSLPLPPVPLPPKAAAAAPAQDEEEPPLVLVHQVEPAFPVTILRRQKKGGVVVRFVVQPDGSVTQPEVVKSTNPYLNPHAIQAVAQWKFQPLPREQPATAELSFDLRQTLSE